MVKEGLYKAISEDWLNQFHELLVIDSSNNEDVNSLVTGKSGGKGWFIMHSRTTSAIELAMADTRPSDLMGSCWYLGIVALISSILSMLILYSKNLLSLSDSFHGGLARAFVNLRTVLHVNNSLCDCFFLASRLTIMSLSLMLQNTQDI